MANLLLTDPLSFNVRFNDEVKAIDAFYDDYIKDVLEKALDQFGIPQDEATRYALYDMDGERLPKPTRIYDNTELVDGVILLLKER